MAWDVRTLPPFAEWFKDLANSEQASVRAYIMLLRDQGVDLGSPQSSAIKGAKHGLRELRIQSGGRPLRVLYAFDRNRAAILILGGDKTGDKRWYDDKVPKADKLFGDYLASLPKPKAPAGKKGRKR